MTRGMRLAKWGIAAIALAALMGSTAVAEMLGECHGQLDAQDASTPEGLRFESIETPVERGATYRIVAHSDDFVPVLGVIDPNRGNEVIAAAESADGQTVEVKFRAPRSATLLVVITSLEPGGKGDYHTTLELVSMGPDDGASLPIDEGESLVAGTDGERFTTPRAIGDREVMLVAIDD